MTYDVAKEKLHYLIETISEEKVMAIYTLLEGDKYTYDEETIARLEKISADAFSGKTKIFTWEESLEDIRTYRNKYITHSPQ